MINTYLGTFNNTQELKAHARDLKISEYKNLVKRFNTTPTMEISSLMSDIALTLVKSYGLTWEQIEQLEA